VPLPLPSARPSSVIGAKPSAQEPAKGAAGSSPPKRPSSVGVAHRFVHDKISK